MLLYPWLQASWETSHETNEMSWQVDELYPPTGHPLDGGAPSKWDSRRDPFHVRASDPGEDPVALDVGDRMPVADDVVERARLASKRGVEGSWGDRQSFLRVHHYVPDTYRRAVVEARGRADSAYADGVV